MTQACEPAPKLDLFRLPGYPGKRLNCAMKSTESEASRGVLDADRGAPRRNVIAPSDYGVTARFVKNHTPDLSPKHSHGAFDCDAAVAGPPQLAPNSRFEHCWDLKSRSDSEPQRFDHLPPAKLRNSLLRGEAPTDSASPFERLSAAELRLCSTTSDRSARSSRGPGRGKAGIHGGCATTKRLQTSGSYPLCRKPQSD